MLHAGVSSKSWKARISFQLFGFVSGSATKSIADPMRGLFLVNSNTCGFIAPMCVTVSAASILRQAEPEMACLMVILQHMHFQCKHWQSAIPIVLIVSVPTAYSGMGPPQSLSKLCKTPHFTKNWVEPVRSFHEPGMYPDLPISRPLPSFFSTHLSGMDTVSMS